jgi:hypothetical protein
MARIESETVTAPPVRWALAAWGYLLLTLASGLLLRYQWTGHARLPFDARYLLHAHSHVALLGWAFVGVFALLLAREAEPRIPRAEAAPGALPPPAVHSRITPTDAPVHAAKDPPGGPGVLRLGMEATVHLLILTLFAAFLLQGYAFWSILLSTLHLLLGFALVGLHLRRTRGELRGEARRWVDLSLVWYVVASVGPWMLALAGRMGEAWVEAWVGYYLTLLFQGWLAFALVGLLAARNRWAPPRGSFALMGVGTLPSVLPRMTGVLEGTWVPWAGWVGSFLFGLGFAAVGLSLLARRGRVTSLPAQRVTPGTLLWISMGAAALLVGILVGLGTLPPVLPRVVTQRNLVVGFVHLQLLGFVSAALVLLLLRPRSIWGTALFLAGGWAMTLAVLWTGGLQLRGDFPSWPVQWVLTGLGAVTLAGAFLLRPEDPPGGVSRPRRGGMPEGCDPD